MVQWDACIPAEVLAAVSSKVLAASDPTLFAFLRQIARSGDECIVSHQQLADCSGGSVSTVKRGLARLEAAGFITRQQRGRGDVCTYRLIRSKIGHIRTSLPEALDEDAVVAQGQVISEPPRRSLVNQGQVTGDLHNKEERFKRVKKEENILAKPAAQPDDDFDPDADIPGLELVPVAVKPKADVSDDFERFWKAYPNQDPKGSKQKAAKSYAKVRKTVSAQELLDGIDHFRRGKAIAAKNHWSKKASPWPHVSTWLNDARWTDEAPLDQVAAVTGRPGWATDLG